MGDITRCRACGITDQGTLIKIVNDGEIEVCAECGERDTVEIISHSDWIEEMLENTEDDDVD